ncbi:class I SAM-dependent methyltransferase (plasmid) [Rhizobium lusitanum]|uniref:class I SAM-dependent methyltransferase n=1 Tax=Rhizobium lusitanum TaxID=293958 RepID=UPI001607F524|nr:class I SAM-dependent methyltransferase [Rhizobium lusitanum]QND45860.1 class I SAM-dependent methyltransferase [Rhizobium lusitanum]
MTSNHRPHAEAGLRVFEVDRASTQQWKRQCLEVAAIAPPDAVRFVPVDFEHDSLSKKLVEAGFSIDQHSCFCWMSVTVHLTPQAVFDTLSFVASQPAGSSITFDYRVPGSQLGPMDRFAVDLIEQEIAALGEPWLSAGAAATTPGAWLQPGRGSRTGSDQLTLSLTPQGRPSKLIDLPARLRARLKTRQRRSPLLFGISSKTQ